MTEREGAVLVLMLYLRKCLLCVGQQGIITIFLTDPYIIVIATMLFQLFRSWSEGEEREGEEVDRFGERTTKHKNH